MSGGTDQPQRTKQASALDILDGLAAHYREKRLDLLRWPWPFFAAQWARMIDAETRRTLRERRRKERQADAAEQRKLEGMLRG